jgi:hypothetical protein
MFRPARLLRAGLALILMLGLLDLASPDASAQKKSTPPPRPNVQRAGRAHYSVVQARDPHWRPVLVAPNHPSAHVLKARLERRGFQVRLRHGSGGTVLVSARMMHWHAVGIYVQPVVANQVVAMLHYRGMQARVRRT